MVPLAALIDRATGRARNAGRFISIRREAPRTPSAGRTRPRRSQPSRELAGELPPEFAIAWTGTAFEEKKSGGSSAQVLLFGLVFVFLILAAQYERWSLPVAVLLSVPFAFLGALAAIWLRGMPNDVYFQIGLVTLVGLSAKNAILIVEFAAQQREQGKTVLQAATEAARLRFRPIVMTSFAFILGVLPLALSSGAGGAASRSRGPRLRGHARATCSPGFPCPCSSPGSRAAMSPRQKQEQRSAA